MDHNAIAGYLSAAGTIFVAILAIWGDWLRAKFSPPKLVIEPHNLRGTLTKFNDGKRVIFYHLKVVNLRKWFTVKNCRVILSQIHRQGPAGQVKMVSLPVPEQYVWSPAELSPVLQTVHKEAVFDLGYIVEGESKFIPRLYSTPNDFKGFVWEGDAVRFSMEIVADKFMSENYQVFEVAWNGKWSDNLNEMGNNLSIKEVSK